VGLKTYKSVDQECSAGLVIMLSCRDDIPSLAISAPTGSHLQRSQVCPEVTREQVDEEAASVTGGDLNIGKRPGGGLVTLLCLFKGGLVKLVNGPGSLDGSCEGNGVGIGQENGEFGDHGGYPAQ